VLQEAYEAGALLPSSEHRALAAQSCAEPPPSPQKPIDPLVSYVGITGWAKIHGMTMLELTQHLHGIADRAAFYRSECLQAQAAMGLASA
jgi:hypothetical protein